MTFQNNGKTERQFDSFEDAEDETYLPALKILVENLDKDQARSPEEPAGNALSGARSIQSVDLNDFNVFEMRRPAVARFTVVHRH